MFRILALAFCLVLAVGLTPNRAFSQSSGGNNFAVVFLNACNRRIQTAIHYRDLRGNWVTNGWWTLEPGRTALVGYTTNRIFYMYAESIAPVSSRIFWNGSARFDYIRGSSNTYGFRERNMNMNTWGTWTERFTCN